MGILQRLAPGETVKGGRAPGKAARWLQRLVLERRYRMPVGALREDVDLRDIGFDAPGRVYEHIPSPWGVLRRILRRGEITSEDVFIDIGCGMGAVVVEAAARYDFRRVIGIDVVPQFTEVAEETIARGRDRLRCRDVEIVTGDVLEYELAEDVSVVYMADPVRGQIFDAVVTKLIASVDRNPRRLRIIYNMPVEGGRLERTGRARLVRYGRRRNRPWTTAPDLAMYEIVPAGDGAGAPARLRSFNLRALGRRLIPGGSSNGAGGSGEYDDGTEARRAIVQIASSPSTSGSRVVSQGSTQDLDRLGAVFERDHCVRLPQFLDAPLLDRIRTYVEEGDFSTRRYGAARTELCMERGKAAELLLLLTNDPHLFGLVRTITGCKRIGGFDASVYRLTPDPAYADPWHGEIFGHGMLAMSIDLSDRPYSGGALETRDRYSRDVLHRAETEPGDALLVRLAPFLQHRVTAVEGDSPRTVYEGRLMLFKSGTYSKLAQPRLQV